MYTHSLNWKTSCAAAWWVGQLPYFGTGAELVFQWLGSLYKIRYRYLRNKEFFSNMFYTIVLWYQQIAPLPAPTPPLSLSLCYVILNLSVTTSTLWAPKRLYLTVDPDFVDIWDLCRIKKQSDKSFDKSPQLTPPVRSPEIAGSLFLLYVP